MKEQYFVFIMEMYGEIQNYHRGIVARHEAEAKEIAELRGHTVKQCVRVEKLIESKGE